MPSTSPGPIPRTDCPATSECTSVAASSSKLLILAPTCAYLPLPVVATTSAPVPSTSSRALPHPPRREGARQRVVKPRFYDMVPRDREPTASRGRHLPASRRGCVRSPLPPSD